MTAFKCDRCGTLEIFRRGTVRVEYHKTLKVGKVEGSPTQQGYGLDLCLECSREFIKFIDSRPKRRSISRDVRGK